MNRDDQTGSNQPQETTDAKPTAAPRREGSGTGRRGFASMDEERQRAIASEGGRAAHARGTAHEFTSEEAREAGRKGGEAVSQNREHMAAIGRRGGEARGNAHRRALAARAAAEEESKRNGSRQERSYTDVNRMGAPGRE
jgi:general stress protein YciG